MGHGLIPDALGTIGKNGHGDATTAILQGETRTRDEKISIIDQNKIIYVIF
jgi:hypothetical protein